MSTKRTIDYEQSAHEVKGKKQRKPKTSVPFHLYSDMQDDLSKENGTVYLEMQGIYFSASTNSVTVGIPPDIWNRIVAAGPVKVRKGSSPEFPHQKATKGEKRASS
jgi:hypothetical protein